MANLEDRIPLLQEEIVVRVIAIKSQKDDKKTTATSYNESIKALEAERDNLILELEATKEQIKEGVLVDAADEILEANPTADHADLSLID